MEELQQQIRDFINVRDWQQFHSPKNISMALSVEVSELVEIFQWLTHEQSQNLSAAKKQALEDEIGDVMIYLLDLASKFSINPIEAAKKKLSKNELKYPIEKAHGSAKKYTEFDQQQKADSLDILDQNCRLPEPNMDSWFTLDFETANNNRNSVCAIGLAFAQSNELKYLASTLIRPPEMRFDDLNIGIHGITPDQVRDKPQFDLIWKKIRSAFEGATIFAHSAAFDFSVLKQVINYYGLPYPELNYYCTVTIARKLWPELQNHKLNSLADYFAIDLLHHDAGSDARACALIVIKSMRELRVTSIKDLLEKLRLEPKQLIN